jgi:uncharacterized integral membrane protein
MIRLIFSIFFLIVLAVFIAFNAKFTTDVNLYGYKLEGIPVVAVVLLTLVAGVLYSFGLYLIAYFSKRSATKEKDRKRKNAEKAKDLKNQEQELKDAQANLEKTTEPLPEPAETPVVWGGTPNKKKVRVFKSGRRRSR